MTRKRGGTARTRIRTRVLACACRKVFGEGKIELGVLDAVLRGRSAELEKLNVRLEVVVQARLDVDGRVAKSLDQVEVDDDVRDERDSLSRKSVARETSISNALMPHARAQRRTQSRE